MGSLRNKVFVFIVALLLLVQAISLWTVFQANKVQEQQQVNYRLDTAISVFRAEFESRRYYLDAFAQTAARDYGLKDVFDGDTRSFLVALNNHRKRINADMAIAVDNQFSVIGQLINESHPTDDQAQSNNPQAEKTPNNKIKVGPDQGQLFSLKSRLNEGGGTLLYLLDQQVYQLSFAPLKTGNEGLGWVGFGYRIDNEFAQQFADITGLNVDFLLRTQDQQWRDLATATPMKDNSTAKMQGSQIVEGLIPEELIAVTEQIGQTDKQTLYVAIYGSRSNLLEALNQSFGRLMVLEGGIVLLAMLVAYLIAGTISRPVRRLVQQAKYIASGNYTTSVDITEGNELGQLAVEFNLMQEAVLVREQAISHRAFHNPLTELPNLNALVQRLEALLEEGEAKFTLFYLDIRRTRAVNDSLGYEVGNQLIQEVGRRLNALSDKLELSHVGADEFALLVEGCSKEILSSWSQRIDQAMEQAFVGEGIQLHLQVNSGIAQAPVDADTASGLLQKADTALSYGKRKGNTFQLYDTKLDAHSALRLSLVYDLKRAIKNDQLVLFYQPKLNLKSGQIHHLEALVRWQHPSRGLVPPDDFITIAEQTGQIDALTQWVLTEAARQYQQWADEGLVLSIAVNISAENLKDPQFTSKLSHIWQLYQLPQNAISLEVTESAVVADPESAIAMLTEIREAGIKLSIDDYGTGYSSLAQLKHLPVQELKIDRSFVAELNNNVDDPIIVRSTINLAHDMGLSVVAEGIEDQETLEWLKQNDCDFAQGYFISRPQPAEVFAPWLLESEFSPLRVLV